MTPTNEKGRFTVEPHAHECGCYIVSEAWAEQLTKEEYEANDRANAKLFSCAPEILRILEILVEQGYHPHLSTLSAAREIIAEIKSNSGEIMEMQKMEPNCIK